MCCATLAIFSGGFTVRRGRAAVVNEGGANRVPVREAIADLIAKSLIALDRDADLALVFLLETIRRLRALEKLGHRGERDRAARRHAAYFRDLFPRPAQASAISASGERTNRQNSRDRQHPRRA